MGKIDLIEHVLEPLIDKHGLTHILVSLELLCAEKSVHIETNWQDHDVAQQWNTAAGILNVAANKVQKLNI